MLNVDDVRFIPNRGYQSNNNSMYELMSNTFGEDHSISRVVDCSNISSSINSVNNQYQINSRMTSGIIGPPNGSNLMSNTIFGRQNLNNVLGGLGTNNQSLIESPTSSQQRKHKKNKEEYFKSKQTYNKLIINQMFCKDSGRK